MSLENWVEYAEPTSPGETKDLLGIVERSLADPKVEAVSTDLRFIAASTRCSVSRTSWFYPNISAATLRVAGVMLCAL